MMSNAISVAPLASKTTTDPITGIAFNADGVAVNTNETAPVPVVPATTSPDKPDITKEPSSAATVIKAPKRT